MKRINKRLSLNRETVKHLSSASLGRAVGGGLVNINIYNQPVVYAGVSADHKDCMFMDGKCVSFAQGDCNDKIFNKGIQGFYF